MLTLTPLMKSMKSSNNIHCAVFQLFIFLIRRIYSDGRHCLQPFKLAECWFDHLSLRWDHLSIIFSHLSPPPYFAYLTKTTIHHGTLKYNVEPLEPTAENTRACSDISTPFSLVLSPRFCLAQFGAESQMLIWFQSNICVFNVEHLPSDKLILALIQFYISGEGRAEGTQYHLDKPHQFSSPITAPNIVAGIVWTFCCLLHGSEKAWSSYQFIMMAYCVPHYYILSLYSGL